MTAHRCALFDLDGTLFDSSEGVFASYRKGLAHFGITVEDDRELMPVMGPSLYLSFHEIFGLEGEQVQEAVRLYRVHYNAEGIYQVKMYEGIEPLLRRLKREGFTLCVATTKPQTMAEKILGFSGIAPYFDAICGSELDGRRSDKAELIDYAMKQTGFTDKNRVYMIGDRHYDMEGAVRSGVHALGVTYGFGSREELLRAGAECLADSPRQVGDRLEGAEA